MEAKMSGFLALRSAQDRLNPTYWSWDAHSASRDDEKEIELTVKEPTRWVGYKDWCKVVRFHEA